MATIFTGESEAEDDLQDLFDTFEASQKVSTVMLMY